MHNHSLMSSKIDNLMLEVAPESYLTLFDLVKDTMFWVKDAEGRFVKVNSFFCKYVNCDEEEMIGKTDYQLFPKEVASVYHADDLTIMKNSRGIYEKLELLINRFGEAEWRQTTKLPLLKQNQSVIGTVGISTSIANRHDMIPQEYQAFTRVVDFARSKLHEGVGVKEMAKFMNVSISTLNRRFQQYLYMTPQKLIYQLKIAKACELLESSMLNVSEIAHRCGYDSSAAFSRSFKTVKSVSPMEYRKREALVDIR